MGISQHRAASAERVKSTVARASLLRPRGLATLTAASWVAVSTLCLPARAQTQDITLPPIPNIAGKVLTVHGPVAPSTLGETLMHEHIFVHFQLPIPDPPNPATRYKLSLEKVSLANLWAVRAGDWMADNDFIGDFATVRAELMDYVHEGGHTIVDVTNIPIGRDPRALYRMSYATGLNIIMGAGWYQKRYQPLDMSQLTLDYLTAKIVRDVAAGVDGTSIRSGIIGEVGINGHPLTPNELKSTRASARAARLTGAPISFHVGGWHQEKLRILDIVASEGVDLHRVVMSHSDSMAIFNLPLARKVLARGAYLEFDWLGALGSPGGYLGRYDDYQVAQAVAELVKEGYVKQIVLSHDTCNKLQLKRYGGFGYTYINDYFLPALEHMGVSKADIHEIMYENPARVLTFVAPQPVVKWAKTEHP